MKKAPSSRKKPVRKIVKSKIKKGRSYTAKDAANILGIDESVFHRWIRDEGLITIDNKKPAMVHWQTFQQFADHKNSSYKMETGKAGDFPCLSCFMKKRPLEDKVVIQKTNDKYWKAKATCPTCGSKMNMNVSASDFLISITWGYEVVQTLPVLTIKDSPGTSSRTSYKSRKKRTTFTPEKKPFFNPVNERIKHRFFERKLLHYDTKTVDMIVSAIGIYEECTQYKDFKLFCYNDVKEFQKYLLDRYTHSIQSANRVMSYTREFFLWLREQDGYKKIKFDDADDLQLSRKDKEKAKAVKPKDYLSVEKWQELILGLNPKTDLELRGQAMLATLLLTGARADALVSFNIGDFNLQRSYAFQDAEHVNSKFSSSYKTNLWKFKPELLQILNDWIDRLINIHGFENNDPLFPKVNVTIDAQDLFMNDGFIKARIKSTSVLREELYRQLSEAGLGHYTPHTIRNSIVALFHSLPLTLEQQKAISQNMSHQNLGTTIGYCQVSEYRQDELIEQLDIEELLKSKELQENPKYKYILSQMKDADAIDKVFKALTND